MIFEKLSLIQQELSVPKNQYNSFGKYSFRSCEDIFQAVKPLLAKHGVALVVADDLVNMGERFYIKATATIYDTSDATQNISVSAYAREEESKKGMDASQVTGTASSYARKYALNGLFALDDNKDADTDEFARQDKLICESCKKEITDTKRIDGKTMTARQVADFSISHYKKCLCADCARKMVSDGSR